MLLKTAVSTRQHTPTVYRPSPSNPPYSAASSVSNKHIKCIITRHYLLLHIYFNNCYYISLFFCSYHNALLQTMLQTQMQKTISQNVHIDVCCDVSEQCFSASCIKTLHSMMIRTINTNWNFKGIAFHLSRYRLIHVSLRCTPFRRKTLKCTHINHHHTLLWIHESSLLLSAH